jgi:DNA-binding winged helix-turn-helix (wHTH) protein/Tol biopolymer transport system component
MALLCYFIERPNQVISIEEISENVWNSRYVTNTAIQRVIGLIRKALDDDKNNPEYIETIAKKGYRLIAQVEKKENDEQPCLEKNRNSGAEESNRPSTGKTVTLMEENKVSTSLLIKQKNSRLRLSFLAYASLCIVLLTLTTLFLNRTPAYEIPEKVVPFSSQPNIEEHPEFSPDGRHIIYVNRTAPGQSQLMLQAVDSNQAVPLSDKDKISQLPKWSFDGSALIAVRKDSNIHASCKIIRIKLDMTNLRKLNEEVLFSCRQFAINGLAWDAERNLIIFSAYDRQGLEKSNTYQFNTKTEKLVVLTNAADEGRGDRILDFDHYARKILFSRDHFLTNDTLFSLDLSSRKIAKLYAHTDLIDFARADFPNNRLFFVSKSRMFHHQINSKKIKALNNSSGYQSFDFSAENDNLAVASFQHVSNIVERKFISSDSLDREKMKIDSSSRDYMPNHLTQNGELVFVSERSGSSQIWLKPYEEAPIQITNEVFDFRNTTLRSQPKGEHLVFYARNKLQLLNLRTKDLIEIETGKNYSDLPNWSNDGTQLYYYGVLDGEEQIWRINPFTLKQKQITQNGGFMSAESPDSKGLYFNKSNRTGLWYLPFDGNRETQVIQNFPSQLNSGLIMTEKGILFFERHPEHTLLKRVEIPSHKVTEITKLENRNIGHLSAAWGSNLIYYVKNERLDSDIILIQ